jgi:hypothetical protein
MNKKSYSPTGGVGPLMNHFCFSFYSGQETLKGFPYLKKWFINETVNNNTNIFFILYSVEPTFNLP